MVEWEHKESTWLSPAFSTSYKQKGEHWAEIDGAAVYEVYEGGIRHSTPNESLRNMTKEQRDKDSEVIRTHREKFDQWKTRAITFSEWLDLNCKGGWEVFHISKEVRYQKGNSRTGWPSNQNNRLAYYKEPNNNEINAFSSILKHRQNKSEPS